MKCLKPYLFIFFSFFSFSHLKAQDSFVLNIDSLPINLAPLARVSFSPTAEDTTMVNSQWVWFQTHSNLDEVGDSTLAFKGYAAYQWQIKVAQKWINKPLLLSLEHSGSSKVFLDGQLIVAYGEFGSNQVGYNPQLWPATFALPDTLPHQIAILYQNHNWQDAFSVLSESGAGISASLSPAQSGIRNMLADVFTNNLITGLLGGFFVALTLLHFVYFLFNRGEKSNLWFSLFIGCIAWMFIGISLSPGLGNVALAHNVKYSTIPVLLTCLLALEAFVYDILVIKRRFIQYINLFLGALILFYYFQSNDLSISIISWLIVIIALEVLIRISVAIKRKQAGVKIIGIGLYLPLLLLLTMYVIAFSANNIEVHISLANAEGVLFLTLMILTIFSPPVSMSAYLAWKYAVLSARNLDQEREKKKILEGQKEVLEKEVLARTKEVVEEKEKTESLLLNILPKPIADELKNKGEVEAKYIEPVSILFTDFVNFTGISATLSAQELVSELHTCFKAFDEITARYGLEKIKTIGDAYFAVSGLIRPDPKHAENTVNAAKEMLAFIEDRKKNGGVFGIRLGIHTGGVAAGIVGTHKFAYDIWGDAVNTASRMESSGEAGKINLSHVTAAFLPTSIKLIPRGALPVKNRGNIEMFFVGTDE